MPLMLIGNDQAIFGMFQITMCIAIIMGQGMANYAVMESTDIENVLELQTRFDDIWQTLQNKADASAIPKALADLATDSTHRVVTDEEKTAWNAKSNFSGDYNDLTNKPTIPSIDGLATTTYVDDAVSQKACVRIITWGAND
jgi:hypothetical protein